jgi:hypothetical protein
VVRKESVEPDIRENLHANVTQGIGHSATEVEATLEIGELRHHRSATVVTVSSEGIAVPACLGRIRKGKPAVIEPITAGSIATQVVVWGELIPGIQRQTPVIVEAVGLIGILESGVRQGESIQLVLQEARDMWRESVSSTEEEIPAAIESIRRGTGGDREPTFPP